MPYSVSRPKKDLRDAINKRHPKAKENEIKQFIHVWNSVFKESGSEARAFASAWGVLNKNKNLKPSHETTDPEQTKKDVNKWEKKHNINPPKKDKKKKKSNKKSNILQYLVKFANELDEIGMVEEAGLVDSIINNLTQDL